MDRPNWDDYFMELAYIASKRSTCMRRSVGAIIVKEKRILTTGYNGTPSHLRHCDEVGCLRAQLNVPSGERHEICRGLHAEQNALLQASLHGVSVAGSSLYCTHQPCSICAKMLINAGVKEIVYAEGYPDELSLSFLTEAQLMIRKIEFTKVVS